MTETARELAERFGLKREGRGWAGTCPACGYPTGFKLHEREGRVLWSCVSCTDRAALTRAVIGNVAVERTAAPERSPNRDDGDRRRSAMELWDKGMPLTPGDPVSVYLAGRDVPPPASAPLRYLRQAKHPSGAFMPCVLALVTDAAGHGVALHRTFLAPGGAGKAKAEPVRMTLGMVRGGAVRLYPPGPRLVVAEGIETALSAALLLRAPAWAAVSAGNLGDALILPAEVREIIVAADHDAPGRAAAQRAAARWKAEGRKVRIALPDKPGTDFNDLWRERATRGE